MLLSNVNIDFKKYCSDDKSEQLKQFVFDNQLEVINLKKANNRIKQLLQLKNQN